MRLLSFQANHKLPAQLETERVVMRRPCLANFNAWSNLRKTSQEFLQPFEPSWTRDELSRSSFKTRLRRHEADIASGRGLPWFLFSSDSETKLLGGITVSNIRRGVSETGTLGYWMGETYAGKGFMREAVNAVCDYLFTEQKLHRIEASTVLDNIRSQQLLIKCGFQKEGVARSYLKINGVWRDHYLFARLNEDI